VLRNAGLVQRPEADDTNLVERAKIGHMGSELEFQTMYEVGTPPWVIDEPQSAVVDLEACGEIRGAVLDVGTGTGEHTILLTRLGYEVLGVDVAPLAVEQARAKAAESGVAARFEVADVLATPGEHQLARFDTVLDSALFHNFMVEDRVTYVRVMSRYLRSGGTMFVLALAVGGGLGPEVNGQDLRRAFYSPGWAFEDLSASEYQGVIRSEGTARRLGRPPGSRVTVPAWLARIRRT
jgi:SAM-dependent methyltransferase